MGQNGYPPKAGLYSPEFEHDACGVGFVANIKGKKSHNIVQDGLRILVSLDHRGARGCEENTGDGAGVLLQIPDSYFRSKLELPPAGDYAVGMVFLPPFPAQRAECERQFEQIVTEEGQTLLGWRTVRTDSLTLGRTAKRFEPLVRQVFIGKGADIEDQLRFERKLFVIRRRAELGIRYAKNNRYFYIPSLSSRAIVYKGMLTPQQVGEFYTELGDPLVESAIALVHSRFSTNTFPSWERAHPYRYMLHNGEINTLRGNVNWMHARQALFDSQYFGDDLKKVLPIIDSDGSDSSMFDNCLEFLTLTGRSLPHAIMMMIPEPWLHNQNMDDDLRAFYQYHSCLIEPWDGPASIVFTDGRLVGAVLDRNGLRPSRYYVLKDDRVVLASEVGVLNIPASQVISKGRVGPGEMMLVDTAEAKILKNDEIKAKMASEQPYREWVSASTVKLDDLPRSPSGRDAAEPNLLVRQKAFGYTQEDLHMVLEPMGINAEEPIGSMGIDTPLAVLSDRPQLLYSYFKQLFAQVTNPPIDAIRESIVTSAQIAIGPERNLLTPQPEECRQIVIDRPIITNEELEKIRNVDEPGLKAATLSMLFPAKDGGMGLQKSLDKLFASADQAVADGANILILSDRGISKELAPIPSLLAAAGLHHHLIRTGMRNKVGLVLESGEPREVHHFALLIGYGVGAINPYLAFESISDMANNGYLDTSGKEAIDNYIKAAVKGIVKTMSKMGISTVQSYRGAQIFEAIGISREVIDRYFTWTPSRIGGIGIGGIAQEAALRHDAAFRDRPASVCLESGGNYKWRSNGEQHLFNPESIHRLQIACRNGDYSAFKAYSYLIDNQSENLRTLRGLLEFKTAAAPVPIEEVEPVDSIVKRFKTGAMSFGSISKEAHEAIAIAMNSLGAKSNTGEGGEDPERFADDRCSAIKQVASGRFGVTSNYLVNAQEIQIKMAQGAKPGEGGQLPGGKVYPWIAKVRLSTPGVPLISPPPHHDIYSIEDLAQLIYDLKNANRQARISVKLVSEVGVGTVAAGVAKAGANVVLIGGYDGGTGASPQSSIRHAGLPWELGLAETHQTLVLNNLRDRIVVEADGKLLTGRDVAIAALLGAQEFGFATGPLITLGCTMMRVCHLDTCPMGVATQNPELRKSFTGGPENVVNFMKFVAEELREVMSQLGFRTVEEMVGRTDKLKVSRQTDHWKARHLDLSALLYQPDPWEIDTIIGKASFKDPLARSLDVCELLDKCEPALSRRKPVELKIKIATTDRTVGTILGSEITRRYGEAGLPEDTIRLAFTGSAGQSFGAFIPKGLTLDLAGDCNDYVGKGLSGGKIIVGPAKGSEFAAEDNVIVGNVALYGATSGEAYISGAAGERFAVRNSGASAVVEAVGDHACEYMTGGRVVVLGPTGRNFAAGMSGGIAYVFDADGSFPARCNKEMVELQSVDDQEETEELMEMIRRHADYTGSLVANKILSRWSDELRNFVKVLPVDFYRMQLAIDRAVKNGLTGDDALMAAFESGKNGKHKATVRKELTAVEVTNG